MAKGGELAHIRDLVFEVLDRDRSAGRRGPVQHGQLHGRQTGHLESFLLRETKANP
jgi:hypothetical protein